MANVTAAKLVFGEGRRWGDQGRGELSPAVTASCDLAPPRARAVAAVPLGEYAGRPTSAHPPHPPHPFTHQATLRFTARRLPCSSTPPPPRARPSTATPTLRVRILDASAGGGWLAMAPRRRRPVRSPPPPAGRRARIVAVPAAAAAAGRCLPAAHAHAPAARAPAGPAGAFDATDFAAEYKAVTMNGEAASSCVCSPACSLQPLHARLPALGRAEAAGTPLSPQA